jgi:hypothetical protein
MNFVTRAIISLLAGVGAGLLGFWAVWRSIEVVANAHPGIGHDAWLLAGIFGPGVLVPVFVFRAVTLASATKPS